MKRIGVDWVAWALVRLGIALLVIVAVVTVFQATPLWAQTTSITCTSASGLPVDVASGPNPYSSIIFNFDAQTCTIDRDGTMAGASSVGSMRLFFSRTVRRHLTTSWAT